MQSDLFGGDVTLTSKTALSNWNAMQMAFLAHGAATPNFLGQVLECEPNFALGHAVKGIFCMMLGRSEMQATAQQSFKQALAATSAGHATHRERLYVEALGYYIDGKLLMAIECMEQVLQKYPQDALALKISHAIRFILGDAAGMRRSIERVLSAYDSNHPAWGYVRGCYAFALEETGEYSRAETAGRQAVTHTQDDAWGLHAVAHVYDMTGNAKAGLGWLSGRENAWSHCNNFRYHVWWHKALMHLDQGQIEEVLTLYDQEVRQEKTDDYRDISNGASLLMRLELEGIDVGNRWEEMAEISAQRTEDGSLIFADLHYLLALSGGRREDALKTMIGRIHKDAQNNHNDVQSRMAAPGVAAAVGLEAFGEGNYHTAFLNLARARNNMQNAGGSHAQRDVFERMTIDAGIRSGMFEEAQAILDDRKAQRNGKEDAYAAARYQMIAENRDAREDGLRLPAE